ncbi:hypothetical protein JG688_00014150 [Phytophthora aleatoria]|uniref:Uncharacterized protein n=1 Tax=Phytophthora aleatoria TaxID=2496075 RepID=A0A8J5IGB8_9STRA|nr:hypothetical protein JG688_00014150 [Phytophthora aleatoria]
MVGSEMLAAQHYRTIDRHHYSYGHRLHRRRQLCFTSWSNSTALRYLTRSISREEGGLLSSLQKQFNFLHTRDMEGKISGATSVLSQETSNGAANFVVATIVLDNPMKCYRDGAHFRYSSRMTLKMLKLQMRKLLQFACARLESGQAMHGQPN